MTTATSTATPLRGLSWGKSWRRPDTFEMEIAALLVYDQALDANDRQAVETYLQARFLNLQPR